MRTSHMQTHIQNKHTLYDLFVSPITFVQMVIPLGDIYRSF